MSFFKKHHPLSESHPHKRKDPKYPEKISSKALQIIFSDCDDFDLRLINIGGNDSAQVFICYIDGLVTGSEVSESVIRPLTDSFRFTENNSAACIHSILEGAVYSATVKRTDTMDALANCLVNGFCAIVFDAEQCALAFEVRTSNQRSISPPELEKSIKGAKDAFIETLRVNTSLVRRKLRDPDLKIRQTVVGRRSATTVAVVYLQGIVNQEIVAQVQRRLDAIDIDGLLSTGNLEEYITDNPRSPFPQLMYTERPDKFCINLLEGRVGLLVEGLPLGFILPSSFVQFVEVPEDHAQNFLISSALTLLRYIGLLITTLAPALYVAVAMYHQEMIPTRMLLSVIESKQKVPFSTATEVLGMLITFELLQEAGLRLPNPIGETVSIIGALIVGQSAVDAKVVSPVAVIIVALAGIAGYTMPNQDFGGALRICRFLIVFAAVLGGMFGVMVSFVLLIYHLCSLESFGVPYMALLSENSVGNTIFRKPLWKNKLRDRHLRTPDRRNQK